MQRTDRLKAIRILVDAALAAYGAGYPAEILPATEQALKLLRPDDPADVAACVHVAYGALAILAGRGSEGPRHLRASVDLFRSISVASWDPLLFACAGTAGNFLREAETGRELLSQALSGAREYAPAAALPTVLFMIGRDAATTERWAEARGYYEEGARLARDTTQFIWLACILTGHQLKDPTATVAYHSTDQNTFEEVLGKRGVRRATYANRAVQVPNDLDEIIKAIEVYS